MNKDEQRLRVTEAISIRDSHESLSTAGPEYADKYERNIDTFQLHIDFYGEYLIADAIEEADSRGIEIVHPLAEVALSH